MNIYIALIAITSIVCATIIIYRLIEYRFEKLKDIDNYWRGRYVTLWDIFNKAARYELSDDMMSDIEEIKERNK